MFKTPKKPAAAKAGTGTPVGEATRKKLEEQESYRAREEETDLPLHRFPQPLR